MDTNSNGLYDYLEVSIPVDVRDPGVYNASLNPMAPDGTTITSTTVANTNLVQGANTLVMRFDGTEIRTRGVAGPYKVEHLLVWKGSDTPTAIWSVLPQTQAYRSTDFDSAP